MTVKLQTHAQVLAERMKLPAREAVLRHYRADWKRYADRLSKRVPPSPDRAEAAAKLDQAQRDGYFRKCVNGCIADLVSCGLPRDKAERAASFIHALKDAFESCLNDVVEAPELPAMK